MKTVTFYFDPVSPYPYLAWQRLPGIIEKNGVVLEARPILFAGLLKAHQQKGPAEIPPKKNYVWKDILRWSAIHHIPIKGPPVHPFNPLSALRLCEAVADREERLRLTAHILEGCWRDGVDLTDRATLKTLVERVGLDAETLFSEIENQTIKDRVRMTTDEAIKRGVFGVPTFAVDDELFWGHDRLDYLDLYLQGKLTIDKSRLQEMLGR